MAKTLAFDIERFRAALLAEVKPPPELVQKALKKLESKLEAKTTKFFTFQGQVQDKVEVEDHATQLSAADKIISVAGLYARERETGPGATGVAVEVDAVTGVIRLVVGGNGNVSPPALPSGAADNFSDQLPAEQTLETLTDPARTPERELESASQDAPQIVKVRKHGLPVEVYKTLFEE